MGVSVKKLKSIAFDLDTKALQEHYTKGDWHNAYNDIAAFLDKQHFTHSQGSVYDSTTKFSDDGLGKLIEKMNSELTWLAHCIKSIRGYDQPVMIDYTLQLKDSITQDLTLEKTKKSLTKRTHKRN
ncbi:hybrid protein contained Cpp29 and VapD [Helicobacter fennelliae]|uniref:Hybrid protein contained Cpp29 and VapD n=1 Tax=Helicobacter fennelliae TaxID=215 RepID=A0A2X3EMB2_9HELI|nr:VapD [Helicobacter fennelliae]SQC36494.1 hybrid protein contained Cpp29 and VapD [Helicobacter fennelliae]